VLGNCGLVTSGRKEPSPRRMSVGDRLLRRKGLRSDDEERRGRIEVLDGLGDMRTVYVRDEMNRKVVRAIRLERLGHHDGSEIRAANADVDDVANALSGVTEPVTISHGLGELAHVGKYAVDVLHHVVTVDENWSVRAVAKRDVEDRTILGRIDLFAVEHALGPRSEFSLTRKVPEQRQCLVSDPVLGEVQEDVLEPKCEAVESP
jgi:hypothetical protein